MSPFHDIIGGAGPCRPDLPICASCHVQMTATQKFCSECGARAPDRVEAADEDELREQARERAQERFRTLLAKCGSTDVANIVLHAVLGADADQTRDSAIELVERRLSPEELLEFEGIINEHLNP